MKVYNKLIRDKIPEIISNSGKSFKTKNLCDEEYIISLNNKLQEELDEYNEDGEVKELADLVEVIYAILNYKGISVEKFEKLRLQKKEERGGFDKKLFLIGVDDNNKS